VYQQTAHICGQQQATFVMPQMWPPLVEYVAWQGTTHYFYNFHTIINRHMLFTVIQSLFRYFSSHALSLSLKNYISWRNYCLHCNYQCSTRTSGIITNDLLTYRIYALNGPKLNGVPYLFQFLPLSHYVTHKIFTTFVKSVDCNISRHSIFIYEEVKADRYIQSIVA
jgi:hypothetical protein